MLTKCLLIVSAMAVSSDIIWSFSLSIIFYNSDHCPKKKICIVFQNILLSLTLIKRSFEKYPLLGYKKYKLFHVTKFILVLPKFWLIQQSLSRTRCWTKRLHSVSKITLKWNQTKSHATNNLIRNKFHWIVSQRKMLNSTYCDVKLLTEIVV